MKKKVKIREWCTLLPFPAPRICNWTPCTWRFFLASEAVVHEPPCQAESTMLKGEKVLVAMNSGTFEGARGRRRHHETHCPGFLLASLLPSWSSPRKVRRRTHEFPSELPVTMIQTPLRRTRGRKTPNSFQAASGSSLASPLPSWSSRQCPQVVSRRTREFSSTSSTSTTAVFIVDSGKDFSNSTRANVTQILLLSIASVKIGLMEFSSRAENPEENSRKSRQPFSLNSTPQAIAQERNARSLNSTQRSRPHKVHHPRKVTMQTRAPLEKRT